MKTIIFTIGMMLLFGVSLSLADVTIVTETQMDMIGAGKVDMEQIQHVKGDRSYDESTTKVSEKMAAMTGGKEMKNIQIVRLDKKLGWTLNPGTNSYTEFSFEQMKGQMAQAKQRAQMTGPMPEYEWTTKFNKDIGTEKIMEYECKGIRAVSTGVNKDDPKDTIFITNEQWFTADAPGGEEFKSFTDNLSEAIGSGKGILNQMSMNPMMAKFGDQFKEISKEFETAEGLPLKTVLVVEGTINPIAAAMGGQEIGEEAKAMMKKMGMALPGETPEGGRHNFISLTSKVKEIKNSPIDDSKYEIPEGYTKQ